MTVNLKRTLLVRCVCQGESRTNVMIGRSIIIKSRSTQLNDCIGHTWQRQKVNLKKNATNECRETEWMSIRR